MIGPLGGEEELTSWSSTVMAPGLRTRILFVMRDAQARTIPELASMLGLGDRERQKGVAKAVRRMMRIGELDRLAAPGPQRAYRYQMSLHAQLDLRLTVQRAAAVEEARAVSAARPVRRGPEPLEVSALVLDHLTHLRRVGRSEGTIRQRRGFLRRLGVWLEDQDLELLDASPALLVSWTDFFAGRSNRRNAINHLTGFYRWAHETEHLIETNPADTLVRPRSPQRFARPIATHKLRAAIDSAPEPARTWLMLAAYCGLRANEVAHVAREDVLDDGANPMLIVTHGKGDRQRAVPLIPSVIDALTAYPRSGWLFPRQDPPAGPIEGSHVSQRCNRYLHGMGITETLHQLRHWYATQFYQQSDSDLRLVQDLLGHVEPRTTAQYAQPNAATGVRIASLLPGLVDAAAG